jgi:predicted TPR repeat methyltransferase
MSALLKERNKAGEIWGVEKFPDAARSARDSGTFDKVFEGDLEEIITELPRNHFNYVIAGDILEHLVDPWAVCEKLNACLVPGGTFICSIPNIRNLSFLLALAFKGRFAYTDSGVLDRTHLRFFARKDVQEMFVNSGYSDVQVGPVRPKKKLSWRIGKALLGDLVIKVFLVTARKSA